MKAGKSRVRVLWALSSNGPVNENNSEVNGESICRRQHNIIKSCLPTLSLETNTKSHGFSHMRSVGIEIDMKVDERLLGNRKENRKMRL